ncbi:hypothetical protein C0Q70_03513 [Pomacea canaliculata]|uniref:unspecific monooxygenase n=1 Tax=Pomacea canaliculata TaxID=400727 RepID=A0A2T7PSX6_POMCA|nr:hypothetical protein C0Q70_03513 [Pomacea canaliculata]
MVYFDILKAVKGGTLHLLGEKLAKQYGDIVMCRTIIGNLCFLNSARLVRQVFTDKETQLIANDRPHTFTGAVLSYKFKDVGLSDEVKTSEWSKIRKLFHSTLRFYGSGVETLEGTLQTELHNLTETLEIQTKMVGENNRQIPLGCCELEMEHFLPISIRRVLATLVCNECPTYILICYCYTCRLAVIHSVACYNLYSYTPSLRGSEMLIGSVYLGTGAMNGSKLGARSSGHDIARRLERIRTCVSFSPTSMAEVHGDSWYATSTELLKGFFLYMVHHPRVMKKVQEEIDRVLGQKIPSLEDRRSLPFTEAAILEALRVVSAAPLSLAHETREDFTTDGFFISKGTIIFENIWSMNRDPTAWEDPEVFRPERFLDDEGQLLPPTHPTRWRFLPFGIGKRSCPGENFARSRAFLYVTTLLQQFDFLPPVNHDLLPLTPDSWTEGVVLQLKPCYVTIKRRSQ